MKWLYVFFQELTHFKRSYSKVISCLIFVLACIYSIYNGFSLQDKQYDTIDNIKIETKEEVDQVLNWFSVGQKGPKNRSRVDISKTFWALKYIPTYTVKEPSSLLPLGIGQAEQYGYYKKITIDSSTYDNDMVEEIANPERLVNGNIDFSFMIIFLLPILLVILTYNISGLEKDLKFEKLISIQSGSIRKWIFIRFLFYILLVIFIMTLIMLCVAFINGGFGVNFSDLLILAVAYVLCVGMVFYLIILTSQSSRSIAFKMISVWLVFCVIVPGVVHQYASMQYPVNYMTEYLDVNREKAQELKDEFYESEDEIFETVVDLYPNLDTTTYFVDAKQHNSLLLWGSLWAIVNEENKSVVEKIEDQNDAKNQLISSSYWFNPVSYVQNQWNSYTATDYYSYKTYRDSLVQVAVDTRIKLLLFESWNEIKVNKPTYKRYLKELDCNYFPKN